METSDFTPALEREILVLDQLNYDDLETKEALETACNALAFASCIHQVFIDNGIIPEDSKVDFALLESAVDSVFGELIVACICLGAMSPLKDSNNTEGNADSIIDLVKDIGKDLEKAQGHTNLPSIAIKSCYRLANRIQAVLATTSLVSAPTEASDSQEEKTVNE